MRICSFKYYLSILVLLSGALVYGNDVNFSSSTGSVSEDADCFVPINIDGGGTGIGQIDWFLSAGIRLTEVINGKTTEEKELGRIGWIDGLFVLGINL